MSQPPFLILNTPREYKEYYESNYQRETIFTFDGVRIFFKPEKFGHAFYENSQHKAGAKDAFSPERAKRMSWIKLTLEHPQADLFKGWNKATKQYDDDRRVSVVFGDFVVVIQLSLKSDGGLKGNFITCYVADNSINKIRNSPKWDKYECLLKLQK